MSNKYQNPYMTDKQIRDSLGLPDSNDVLIDLDAMATSIATVPMPSVNAVSKSYIDISINDEMKVDGNAEITGQLTVNGINVTTTLEVLQKRFLILEEDFKKHEKYPALKEAYEQYKLIEALIHEHDSN